MCRQRQEVAIEQVQISKSKFQTNAKCQMIKTQRPNVYSFVLHLAFVPRRRSEKRSETTVRHSGMFLAGIQTRAAVGLRCGWIPAKGVPE
jgi:hypothetical protein